MPPPAKSNPCAHTRIICARVSAQRCWSTSSARPAHADFRQLSLETGQGPAFEPALALYRRRGFVDGEAFADYVRSPFNQFLHLVL